MFLTVTRPFSISSGPMMQVHAACDASALFNCPRIPGNSGAAIRLSANTGSMLHLVDPLFDMDDAKLRRAGLDYHDLASTRIHADFEKCLEQVPGRVLAFTSRTERLYTDIS